MLPREVLDSFEYGLERVYRELVAYEMLVGSTITQEQIEAIDLVRLAMHIVRGLAERWSSFIYECAGQAKIRYHS